MDLRWLQDFAALAEIGNFTQAATARNLSQGAFSRRIQSLEIWAGAALVNRSATPVRLTEAGERFLDHAREVSEILSNARHEPLLTRTERGEDVIRIAVPMSIATTHLPGWVASWNSSGALRLNISNEWVHEGFSALAVGDLDILICYRTPTQPLQADHEKLESVTIGRDRMIPMAGRGAAQEKGWCFPGSHARPIPILMYQHRTYLGRVVDAILAQAPAPVIGYPIVAAQMASVLAQMVADGAGIAWLPDQFLDMHDGAFEAVHRSGPWTAEMSIVAYRSRAPSRYAVRQIWAQICELAEAEAREPSAG